MILAVDPGIRGTGAAIFDEGTRTLLRAAYVRNPLPQGQGLEEMFAVAQAVLKWADLDHTHGRATLVAEWPQVYVRAKSKGNPNTSLLPLCGVVAHISGGARWGDRTSYLPQEWKGSVEGDAMTERILKRLSTAEQWVIEPCPASLKHNVVDAIGIGLKYLGRLERVRLVPRD